MIAVPFIYIALSMADLWLTLIGLEMGFQELNPLMKHFVDQPTIFITAKVIATGVAAFGMLIIGVAERDEWIVWFCQMFVVLMVALQAYAVVHNTVLILGG
jgi:hypothetical protein